MNGQRFALVIRRELGQSVDIAACHARPKLRPSSALVIFSLYAPDLPTFMPDFISWNARYIVPKLYSDR